MKTLVIDAIIGAGFSGSFTLATQAEKAELAYFTGNQWNEQWAWSRARLEALTVDELQAIYEGLRAERETQAERRAQAAATPAPLVQVATVGMR